jgi:hypothetical protein
MQGMTETYSQRQIQRPPQTQKIPPEVVLLSYVEKRPLIDLVFSLARRTGGRAGTCQSTGALSLPLSLSPSHPVSGFAGDFSYWASVSYHIDPIDTQAVGVTQHKRPGSSMRPPKENRRLDRVCKVPATKYCNHNHTFLITSITKLRSQGKK